MEANHWTNNDWAGGYSCDHAALTDRLVDAQQERHEAEYQAKIWNGHGGDIAPTGKVKSGIAVSLLDTDETPTSAGFVDMDEMQASAACAFWQPNLLY